MVGGAQQSICCCTCAVWVDSVSEAEYVQFLTDLLRKICGPDPWPPLPWARQPLPVKRGRAPSAEPPPSKPPPSALQRMRTAAALLAVASRFPTSPTPRPATVVEEFALSGRTRQRSPGRPRLELRALFSTGRAAYGDDFPAPPSPGVRSLSCSPTRPMSAPPPPPPPPPPSPRRLSQQHAWQALMPPLPPEAKARPTRFACHSLRFVFCTAHINSQQLRVGGCG